MSAMSVTEPAGGAAQRAQNPMLKAIRGRDFRLLWIGQGTSLLGDQFSMIALPWLVLMLTGDPLALGAVLALEGIPRALFVLVGGAITDRLSSRAVMLASDAIRLVLMATLAALALTGHMQMWMIYGVALVTGLVSGFFMPASGAIMPALVDKDNLQAANSVFQGTAQLSSFAGPVLAGGLIALFGHGLGERAVAATGGSGTPDLTGIGLAFVIDALTFLVSLTTLWLIQARPAQGGAVTGETAESAHGPAGVVASIREVFAYTWRDPALRMVFMLLVAANLLLVGPVLVGIPVLASVRLPEGAAAYGLIMGAYSGGNLLGYIVTGSIKLRKMGLYASFLIITFGVGTILLGFTSTTVTAFAILLVMGIGNGYIAIIFITWLQKNTPSGMIGRMMSLLLFTNVGLLPVSEALSGALTKLSLTGLFVGAGVLLVLAGLWAGTRTELREMEL